MARTSYYFDVDGVLANFHEHKDGWKYALTYNFIRNLRPFNESVELVNKMINDGKSVYISTLCASEEAKRARIEWIKEYIPNIKDNHIIAIVGNAKKNEHMRTKKGVLVDDKMANIRAWRKAGFKAVYVENKGQIDLNAIA